MIEELRQKRNKYKNENLLEEFSFRKKKLSLKTYKIISKLRKFVVHFVIRRKRKEKSNIFERGKIILVFFIYFVLSQNQKIRYDKSSCNHQLTRQI